MVVRLIALVCERAAGEPLEPGHLVFREVLPPAAHPGRVRRAARARDDLGSVSEQHPPAGAKRGGAQLGEPLPGALVSAKHRGIERQLEEVAELAEDGLRLLDEALVADLYVVREAGAGTPGAP
jgi:hypothetical protein